MTRRRTPPIRRTPAGIELALPGWVTSLVASSVREVRAEVERPGSDAARRLLAPIDESARDDDPLVTLMRQHALDEVLGTLEQSTGHRVLSEAEAESWLEGLGLLLAARAAQLGVRTEADRRAVRRRDEAFLQVVYAVQLGLIEALDAPPPVPPPS